MIDKNMTLLTQNEVDSILDFLTKNNDTLSSDVMNQGSIDKLVKIITQAGLNRKRQQEEGINVEGCKLEYTINANNQYIELYAVNSNSERVARITPINFLSGYITIDDNSQWGYSIAPDTYCRITKIFRMQYQEDIMEAITKLYALKNYGDENYKIPALFMPEGDFDID